ncbi:MAG: hypothetical protein KF774_19160 [Planctomyces sp.]|nr:hypothetical protein [Planctomyces sp.]
MFRTRKLNTPPAALRPHPRSGGAVIIITLTLLATLAFLGFFFYQWTNQEQMAARGYASTEDYEVRIEEVLDQAYEQLLVGTRDAYGPSALWGGRHSILSHIVGPINANLQPLDDALYSGMGITVTFDDPDSDGVYVPGDDIYFDFDGDGVPDAILDDNANPLVLNFSPAARPDTEPNPIDAMGLYPYIANYRPNAGITYPDINSLFLAYDAQVGGRRVTIPSFFRPQLEVNWRSTHPEGFTEYFTNIGPTTISNTAARSLRPHYLHRTSTFVAGPPGPEDPTGVRTLRDANYRFLRVATPAQSGNTNRILPPFRFVIDRDGDGVANDLGVLSGRMDDLYELDVDTDGDGVPDAIWMDLGLPMIDLPDGRQVVPLVAVKILDADGLLNVNVHGNHRGLAIGETLSSAVLGESLSKSNQGLSPSEVNPVWALIGDADPTTATAEAPALATQKSFVTNWGGEATTSLQAANMELLFLLMGRRPGDGGSIQPGRYGEPGLMADYLDGLSTAYPRAGTTGLDDDGSFLGRGSNAYFEPKLGGLPVPPMVHPLDYGATGNLFPGSGYLVGGDEAPGMGAVRRLGPDPLPNLNPSAWPIYRGFWHDPEVNSEVTDYLIAPYSMSPVLDMQAPIGENHLVDEDSEFTATSWFPNVADMPFRPAEMAGLQLSNADFSLTGEHSRLRELLPFAFRDAGNSDLIRRRFTTDSWDRLEVSHAYPNPAAPRAWEFNEWTGATDLMGIPYSAGDVHFPPMFGAAVVGGDEDPFRHELRRLLWTRIRSGGFNDAPNFNALLKRVQHRLNINQLLVNFDPSGNPVYRPLTPHPVFEQGDTGVSVPDVDHTQLTDYEANPTNGPAFGDINPGTPAGRAAQEWWARYDRQRMARDIYVLLWTLGGGQDGSDYAKVPGIYTDDQVREMAQFAVNFVDALDRDVSITRFEYDADLSDGWNNPDRVAYGVESQLLTFSEVMLINQPIQSADLNRTMHRDDDSAHQFLYVELRNATPFPLSLGDNRWRLVRVPMDMPVGPGDVNVEAAVEFRSSGMNSIAIDPGENLLISCHDGSVNANGQLMPADFYADVENGAELETVVPISNSTVASSADPVPDPQARVDLTWPGHNGFYEVTIPYLANDPATGGAALVGRDSTVKNFDLVLQRRRNLFSFGHGEQLSGGAELWIETDRIRITDTDVVDFQPSGDTQAAVREAFEVGTGVPPRPIASFERPEPFSPIRQQVHPGGTGIRHHSLRGLNEADLHAANDSLTTARFNFWEPVFNRDYSSVMELLSLPLYGHQGNTAVDPDTLTPFGTNRFRIGGATSGLVTVGGVMNGQYTAAVRFLNPYDTLIREPYDSLAPDIPAHYRNRWHRLLEFLTVQDRTEVAVEDRLQWQRRTPGRLNLNTIRDETVLKGLVDDPDQLATVDPGTGYPTVVDRYDSRSWFNDVVATNLLARRDGVDPLLTASPQVRIPGGVHSKPFRGLNHVRTHSDDLVRDTSLDDTLLRALRPLDDANTSNFGLFEARSEGDLTANSVDFHTRNRLLAKIHNRTTNRSHVFMVWTTVGFFEAHRLTASGEVQVGGLAEDIPLRRAFMVCDMTRIEEAYTDPDPTDNIPGYFDFRKFIIYRKLIK